MKILITGITGLFGSYLAREFSKVGTIYGLKRSTSSTRLVSDIEAEIQWVEGDLFDIIALEEAIADMDLVIHAAGMVSYERKDFPALMKTNVEGTTNLVNAMLASGKGKLIHISSVAALGRTPGDTLVNENTKWADSDLNTPYAQSKYLGDLEVWRGVQEGLLAIVVHPSILLGKISDERSSTRIYQYVLEEKKYFPSGRINFLDIRDAAAMVFYLFEKEAWNEQFILNHSAISYQEFFQTMARVFGKKAPTVKVTRFLLEVSLWVSAIARMLGLSKVPLNRQTARLSQLQVTMDNSKATNFLNFQYKSLEETLLWAMSNEKN
jgi:dihydroflavonol-4-reductase